MDRLFSSLMKPAKRLLESACIGVALQALRKRLQSIVTAAASGGPALRGLLGRQLKQTCP